MENIKLITLINGIENAIEVELISAFEIPPNNTKYLIYTKNEKDENGNIIIYIGKLELQNDKQYIINIESDNEWEKIKNIIKSMLKYISYGNLNERNN